jgi:hypothetical protein
MAEDDHLIDSIDGQLLSLTQIAHSVDERVQESAAGVRLASILKKLPRRTQIGDRGP